MQATQLDDLASEVGGAVQKLMTGEPDARKRAQLEKSLKAKSTLAKANWAKAAAASKKVRWRKALT